MLDSRWWLVKDMAHNAVFAGVDRVARPKPPQEAKADSPALQGGEGVIGIRVPGHDRSLRKDIFRIKFDLRIAQQR